MNRKKVDLCFAIEPVLDVDDGCGRLHVQDGSAGSHVANLLVND